MDAMTLLHSRYSSSKVSGPAPAAEVVCSLLESAAHAPDHGRLLPWRLLVFEGEARARPGTVMSEGLRRCNPLATEQSLAQ